MIPWPETGSAQQSEVEDAIRRTVLRTGRDAASASGMISVLW
jgi:hypothetical protein